MAMNKKEQAEMDRLQRELVMAKAFRFTPKVEMDVAIPSNYNQLAVGYSIYPRAIDGRGRVSATCSSATSHGDGHVKTTSQNPIEQYSSRLLALKALRHEKERDFASILADIDLQIEIEERNNA